MARIAYLVHNLGDAAVHRRVRMLRAGGALITLSGFSRDGDASAKGVGGVCLGLTRDAALVQRARAVLANLFRPASLLATCRDADVIVARNLEMLILGVMAKRWMHINRLVYECLDIHRTMLGAGPHHRLMRLIERFLVRSVDLVIYSSPAFARDYFNPVQHFKAQMSLVENKLLVLDTIPARLAPPNAQPWRIAWFGNLRCRRTLAILTELAGRSNGQIEVLIAGKPSVAEFPDFASAVHRPGLTYVGAYSAEDLPALYGQCHFAWAIDFFEEGLNSTWLLPNRLYEASAYGCIPIALRCVETGRWLEAQGAGLLLHEPFDLNSLVDQITHLEPGTYDAMRHDVEAIPADALLATSDDCRALVAEIVA
jgi:succinoglycan biosynthesis protein ExoL